MKAFSDMVDCVPFDAEIIICSISTLISGVISTNKAVIYFFGGKKKQLERKQHKNSLRKIIFIFCFPDKFIAQPYAFIGCY
ncbi:MAG: hypothetical protein VYA14_01845, partial [Pseudomonadota bacterium]|nr:hypothetical protein [Pseudomonadota bacterium]